MALGQKHWISVQLCASVHWMQVISHVQFSYQDTEHRCRSLVEQIKTPLAQKHWAKQCFTSPIKVWQYELHPEWYYIRRSFPCVPCYLNSSQSVWKLEKVSQLLNLWLLENKNCNEQPYMSDKSCVFFLTQSDFSVILYIHDELGSINTSHIIFIHLSTIDDSR